MLDRKGTYAAPLMAGLLLVGGIFGCGRGPGDAEYEKGMRAIREGRLVRARAHLEKAVRQRAGRGDTGPACNRLGMVLWELGAPGDAIEAFQKSRTRSPDSFDALYNLGYALVSEGRAEHAEEVLTEAALVHPQDAQSLQLLGAAFLEQGKWDRARQAYERALRRRPDDPALLCGLALAEYGAQDPSSALKRLQALTKGHPGYAPGHFNLAAVYRFGFNRSGDADRALNAYLEAAEGPDARERAARLRRGETPPPRRARRTREEDPLGLEPRPERDRAAATEAFGRAFRHYAAGDFDEAAQWYTRAVEHDETYEEAFYNLGLTYHKLDRLDAAAAAYRRALELNPASARARYNLALVHYQRGNLREAQREARAVLAQHPDHRSSEHLIRLIRENGEERDGEEE
ncbi:TPR repeat-containing protein [Kiritimatiella glycovorans]|uniref:TPR repeat-containing protein n=2 Tax=Kiritimatiella glycovorans TaxID=1307763 RepID=A0A0G3EGU4_9BACT|nr:TPR repeat-containing protein [Kiritimatiella glycovorans]